MEFKTKKINDVTVKKIPVHKEEDTRPIKGSEFIPRLNDNIFLAAPSKSGKSTVIYNILKNTVSKDTTVLFFVGTIDRDNAYLEMIKYLKKKEIKYETFSSIYVDSFNVLELLDAKFKAELEAKKAEEAKEKEKGEIKQSSLFFDNNEQEIKATYKKPKKSKYRTPKYLIIMDDLSKELNDPYIAFVLRTWRHYGSRFIISSQYFNDLPKGTRAQINIFMVFKGLGKEKLEEIYSYIGGNITFDLFHEIYKNATNERFNFLYIDKEEVKFRKNFDTLYLI